MVVGILLTFIKTHFISSAERCHWWLSGVHGDKERDRGSASGCSQCVCLVGRKEVLITQELVAKLYLLGQQMRPVSV